MFGLEEFELELYGAEYSIEDLREDLGRVVDYFKNESYWKLAMEAFIVNYRKLPMQVAIDSDAFAIEENTPLATLPEWMKSDALGVVKWKNIVMAGRCVFPVKDVNGAVAGFVGWDPFAEPKYLDSKNYGYKAKQTMLYGMEKLPEYYKSKKPVFVTEGLMDTLYLRFKGFQALATLGSYMTPYVVQILSRFKDRLAMVPDNDPTGDNYVKQVKRCLPKAMVFQVAHGKDIEGCRKVEDGVYEQQLLNELESITNPFVRTSLLIRR